MGDGLIVLLTVIGTTPNGEWEVLTFSVGERENQHAWEDLGEVQRRSHNSHKMATAFRSETSCLLMFYAVIRSLKLRRLTIVGK